ncbi:tyrosine-type recombinase/integrase [Xanthomonas graminis]|uniref:tyrosine-type recombinase/integrase n=1 Tax=Xanthomonas graminis TaxID=3390026 RepID=UPI001EFFA97D|nr:tyrosine-type recombinase/integrase [Xanthomonas translucens]UKE75362.1 tyrosine-type recombinase/integrase [Xanthomonas translucens pv. phleipratensis]
MAGVGYQARVRHGVLRGPSTSSRAAKPLPAGFHFLVSEPTGKMVRPCFDHLVTKHLVGRKEHRLKGSAKSSEAAAYDLADYHNYLDARGLQVADSSPDVLIDYLESMAGQISPTNGRAYSSATVSRRRASVVSLLEYCQDSGLLKHRFSRSMMATRSGTREVFAGNIGSVRGAPPDRLVRALDPRVISALFDVLGPTPVVEDVRGGLQPAPELSPPRLMAEVCLHTGLRRQEVCDLQLDPIQLADLKNRDPYTHVAIRVVGKGNKKRDVPFPVWLISVLREYSRTIRKPLMAEALRSGWIESEHGHLFLLGGERANSRAKPASARKFSCQIASARQQLLTRLISINSDSDDIERVRQAAITVHALRHTFALTTFIDRRNRGDSDPSKYVQAVLGHSNSESPRLS